MVLKKNTSKDIFVQLWWISQASNMLQAYSLKGEIHSFLWVSVFNNFCAIDRGQIFQIQNLDYKSLIKVFGYLSIDQTF